MGTGLRRGKSKEREPVDERSLFNEPYGTTLHPYSPPPVLPLSPVVMPPLDHASGGHLGPVVWHRQEDHPGAPPHRSPPSTQARSADPDSTSSEDSEYSSPDASDDDNHGPNGTPAPLPLPHGFSIAESGFNACPMGLTDEYFEIRAHNPAAEALVNRYILYQGAGFGCCVGQITSLHTRHLERHKTPKGYANFVVHYESDGSTAQHTLCFDSYNNNETAKSPVSTWVLLDKT